jgi:sugar/nucleoside kinase (ribokinase family)
MTRIIGIGSALLDILARVPEEFVAEAPGGKGGMVLIDEATMLNLLELIPADAGLVPGGSAANTILGLGYLGLDGRLLAKVGDDANGALYRSNARAAGIDEIGFKVNLDVATGTCISLVTPDSERTMRTCLGAAATMTPEEVTLADFAGCSHAHIEGYMLFNRGLMMHLLKTAKAAGCTISLDLASYEVVGACSDILTDLLAEYVDIVFANEEEAAAFVGSKDETLALDRLAELCDTAVVKVGRRGAMIRRGEETVRVAARLVDAVDTTGAGDLWAAGFLYGHFTGRTLAESGAFGAWVSAEVVKVMGASIPPERWQALRDEMHA